MSKIRIACLGQDLSGGGAERVQLELLQRLDPAAFSVDLCYLRDQGDLYDLLPAGIEPKFFSPGGTAFKDGFGAAFRQFRVVAREADLLFGMMDGIPIYLAALIGRLEKKPSLGWIHNTTSVCFENCNRLHRVLAPRLYPRASQLVCVSEGARQDLLGLYKFKSDPVTIYNPIDVDRVRRLTAEPIDVWMRSWYAKPVVLGVGRLSPQKRFDRLIRGFAQAVQDGLDAHLVLLGQGELEAELRDLAIQQGVALRVFFAGFVRNPYPHMRAAAALALCSDFEGLPTVLLEAMAAGTAIVSVDCPSGPREILEDGRNGLLVPNDDQEALAEGLGRLLGDPGRRREFIAQGARRIEEFRAEKAVARFEQMIRGLAEGVRPTVEAVL
jgi:glycosyltransferase involved in cell wall biosynthesis